jgi:hypothetical protein
MKDAREMNSQGHERLLDVIKPLRPVRQSCVVCRSGSLALNLAAQLLVGVIELDCELTEGRYSQSHLFPDQNQDASCVRSRSTARSANESRTMKRSR